MTVKDAAANSGSDLQRVFGFDQRTIGKIINQDVTAEQSAEEEFDEIVSFDCALYTAN